MLELLVNDGKIMWMLRLVTVVRYIFFDDPAPTAIYTLSLHDALPIYQLSRGQCRRPRDSGAGRAAIQFWLRSEEHTSELQSRPHLVCRLLLEKKKLNLWRTISWVTSTCGGPRIRPSRLSMIAGSNGRA